MTHRIILDKLQRSSDDGVHERGQFSGAPQSESFQCLWISVAAGALTVKAPSTASLSSRLDACFKMLLTSPPEEMSSPTSECAVVLAIPVTAATQPLPESPPAAKPLTRSGFRLLKCEGQIVMNAARAGTARFRTDRRGTERTSRKMVTESVWS